MARVTLMRHPFATALPPLLLLFLVLFPKGGIKVGDAPITWGYVLLGVSAVPLLFVRLLAKPLRMTLSNMQVLVSLIPFQMLFLYSFLVNGIANPSFAISVFTSFFVLPFIFLFLYPPFVRDVDGYSIAVVLRNCLFYAAVFGIFLFFFHPIAGFYIEIPYLTVNAADFGQLEATKHINRGDYLKLISTYNNGNLYGVATLMLVPLYRLLEPRAWRRHVITAALVLTLSRTVWAGLLFEQLLSLAAVFWSSLRVFPRLYLGAALKRAGVIAITAALVLFGLAFNSNSISFLFDSSLGGRASPLAAFQNGSLLPSVPITVFAEILYSSAVDEYGYSGLVAILLIFFGPVFLFLSDRRSITSLPRRAAFKGLVLYALVAMSDGANALIPVMAFYWFLYLVFLCGFPGDEREWGRAIAGSANPRQVTRLKRAPLSPA